jgi:lipopolysaccharide export system protein LptA
LPKRLTLFALILPAIHLAAQTEEAAPAIKKMPALAILPDGSELQGVMLPRYDLDQNLIGVLKAKAVTLVAAGKIAGTGVSIELFNPDNSPRGRIDLERAYLYQEKGVVVARQPVEIQSERLSATGSGLYYSFNLGKGFLLGPSTTSITHTSKETTMKSPASPLRAAALGMALVTQPVVAAPPEASPATEGQVARSDLRATLKASDEANQAVEKFLNEADLLTPETAASTTSEATPLEVPPDPLRTLISAKGGTYVDADAGVLVYLKDVTVNDPRFELSADIDLKVFLEKKPPAEPAPDAEKKPAAGDALGVTGPGFGEVQRIVATGAVHLRQLNPEEGKPPLEARGALFSYDVKTGEIVISGGYPWFSRGSDFFRAKQPNLTLRIDKNFNAKTEGHWETGIRLDQKKK